MAKKCRHRGRTYSAQKTKLNPKKAYGYDPDNDPLTEGESNTGTFLTDEDEVKAWAKLVGKEHANTMAKIFNKKTKWH